MTDKTIYKLCLFMHSGSFDKFYRALSIANATLATGGEVNINLSYGALKRFTKGGLDSVDIDCDPTPYATEFTDHLKRGSIEDLPGMIETGKKFGRLKLFACPSSMAVMNIARDELSDHVDAVTGLVSFLKLVKDADLTLYI